jgi:hypothetical protein
MAKRGMNWGRANRERRMSNRGVSHVTDEKELFMNDPAAQWLVRPQPARPTRQQHHKPRSRKGKTIVIPGDGDPCPRCGLPMEIHEHDSIGDKQLRQSSYYKRWFCCTNNSCKTREVMQEQYKVTGASR